MKKLLALIIIFLMLPASKALAADTSPTDNSTGGKSKQEDSLQKMYDSFRAMDEEQWIDQMGNKDLYGHNKTDGAFELTGLMNQLFFEVKDMIPGDTVTKYIRIYNSSDKDYTLFYDAYRFDNQMPKEGEIDLLDVINLEITKSGDILEEPVFKGKIFDENTNKQVIKLGTIKSGQDPVIFKATVTMDPNAGEEYKNKEAEITWIFKAEGDEGSDDPPDNPPDNPKDPSGNSQKDPPDNPSKDPSKNPENPSFNPSEPSIHTVDLSSYSDKGQYKGTVSKTGDNNYLIIYGLLAVGSLMIGYVLFSKGKKNRKEQ